MLACGSPEPRPPDGDAPASAHQGRLARRWSGSGARRPSSRAVSKAASPSTARTAATVRSCSRRSHGASTVPIASRSACAAPSRYAARVPPSSRVGRLVGRRLELDRGQVLEHARHSPPVPELPMRGIAGTQPGARLSDVADGQRDQAELLLAPRDPLAEPDRAGQLQGLARAASAARSRSPR